MADSVVESVESVVDSVVDSEKVVEKVVEKVSTEALSKKLDKLLELVESVKCKCEEKKCKEEKCEEKEKCPLRAVLTADEFDQMKKCPQVYQNNQSIIDHNRSVIEHNQSIIDYTKSQSQKDKYHQDLEAMCGFLTFILVVLFISRLFK